MTGPERIANRRTIAALAAIVSALIGARAWAQETFDWPDTTVARCAIALLEAVDAGDEESFRSFYETYAAESMREQMPTEQMVPQMVQIRLATGRLVPQSILKSDELAMKAPF